MLLLAGRLAAERALPLDLIPLGREDTPAQRMITTDRALWVVRDNWPRLEVRVHEQLPDARAWLREHEASTYALVLSATSAATLLPLEEDGGA